MKYQITDYVSVFMQEMEGADGLEQDRLVKRFIRVLDRNGDLSQGQKIVREMRHRLVRADGGRWVTVESAQPLTPPQLEIIRDALTEKDHLETVLHPALVAGVRVTVDGQQELDASLAGKLKLLFESGE